MWKKCLNKLKNEPTTLVRVEFLILPIPIFPNHTIERNPHYVNLSEFFQFPNHTIERKPHYVNLSEFFQKPHYSEDHTM